MPAPKERNVGAFVGLIGEGMALLSKKHENVKGHWPAPQYVNILKTETAEGKIPLIVEPGSELARSGGFVTKGVHERRLRGGVQVGESIKLPSNLFNPDGTINEDAGAVLVHEYGHALQNVALRDMPESERARIPIASVEYSNQALAMSVWGEMAKIRNATQADGEYWEAKQKLVREYGGDVFKSMPRVDRSTMRYQDRMSRYPGEFFMEEHPEFFEEKEGKLEVEVRERYFGALRNKVLRQFKAAENGVDLNDSVSSILRNRVESGELKGFDEYMLGRHAEAAKELEGFKPATEAPDMAEAQQVLTFYKREVEHLREISRLEEMHGKLERGQLPSRELAVLHDFAVRNELVKDVWGIKHGELIDFAISHKLGELEANRMGIEEAAGMLGRRLRELHETGYFPEDKLSEILERQKWLGIKDKEGKLRAIRDTAREKSFAREGAVRGKIGGARKERRPI